jgi:hypothetical protein
MATSLYKARLDDAQANLMNSADANEGDS